MDGSTPLSRRRWIGDLWLMLLVAFTLRLGLALYVERLIARTPGQVCLIPGDADGYWVLAGKIANGQDYSIYEPKRFVLRMPGFPVLIALPRVIFGESTLAARCLLAVVATLACGLTYWLGCELYSHTVGIWAAWYTALSPTMTLFGVLMLSETAFAATLLASLIAIHRLTAVCTSHQSEKAVQSTRQMIFLALCAGLWAGVATYIRPTWLYVAPVIAGVSLLYGFGRTMRDCQIRHHWLPWKLFAPLAIRAAVPLGWMCVGVCLSLSPWIIRNAVVTGHFVPTTLWVGPSLYDGLHPHATGDSDMTFFERDQLMATMSEYEMDREYRRRAMEFITANPWRTIVLALKKQARYWSLVPNAAQFQQPLMVLFVLCAVIPLFVLAMFGIWVSRGNVSSLAITAGSLFLFAGLHLLFVGSLRYRLPAEYPLAVLAASGLMQLRLRLVRQGQLAEGISPRMLPNADKGNTEAR